MQPPVFGLDIYRGDSGHWQFKLSYQNGQPVDLTGVVAKSEIRDRPSGAQVIPLDCAITLPNIVEVNLSSANSYKLPTKGAWDLQLSFPSGDVTTVVAGPVTVTLDVTDSTQPYVDHRV